MHDEFLESKRGQIARGVTQELERLKRFGRKLNLWIGDKKSGMCLKIGKKVKFAAGRILANDSI
ncbi:hypothetical protein H5410_059798 [Solanum commersonii]|uniref:Uncharacterized protein n=1 Tax=Solanum commersonii TaxID=4109 RepID=A0A9J5W414_SOLCO|nr:hypothetical protein H5410_059798 [Solanum commersonii]